MSAVYNFDLPEEQQVEIELENLLINIKAALVEWQENTRIKLKSGGNPQWPLFDEKTQRNLGQDFAEIFKTRQKLKKKEDFVESLYFNRLYNEAEKLIYGIRRVDIKVFYETNLKDFFEELCAKEIELED